MAQVPTISMQVDKTQALRDIQSLKAAMLGLRQTIVGVNTASKTLGGSLTGRALHGGLTKGTKAVGGFNEKLFEMAKAAQFAAGPLSGFAARLTAFSSLAGHTTFVLAGTIAVLAGLGVAFVKTAKVAAEFELGLIGVSKASDIVGKSLERFGSDVLRLSSQLALPSDELLTIAENAARLGIQGSEAILKFTKTVGMVTRATDLTAESASTAFARILKVTGTAVNEVDTLANVIVRLGNNVAATESEITEVALTVARASGVFGVTATDAATLGAAFAQFGVQAEVAGSTIGRVLGTINDALKQPGTTAQNLSIIMGESVEDIRNTFETDALGGIFKFLGGLKNLEQQGVSVVEVLRQFGLSGIREAKALLPLVDNVNELAFVMALSKVEMQENAALMVEFGRFSEAASIIFKGVGINLKNIAIALGRELLPLLKGIGQGLRNLTGDADGVAKVIKRLIGGLLLIGSYFAAARVVTVAWKVSLVALNATMLTFRATMVAVQTTAVIFKTTFTAIALLFSAQNMIQRVLVMTLAMSNLRKAVAGVSLAGLLSARSFKIMTVGLVAIAALSEDVRKKIEEIAKSANKLVDEMVGFDIGANIDLLRGLLFGDTENPEEIAKEVAGITAEIEKLMGSLNTSANADAFTPVAKRMEKILIGVFTNSVNAFEQALKEMLNGGGGNFFDTLYKGIKDAFVGGIAAAVTESVKRSLFAPVFQDVFGVLLGGAKGTALAESAAGLPAGSLGIKETAGLFEDLGEVLKDAVAGLDMFAFKAFGIGKGVFGTTSVEDLQTGELIEGTKELIGVTDGLSQKLADFGKSFLGGGTIGALVGGGGLASFIGGGLGKIAGKALGDALGKQVGGKLGKALGPIGGLLGSVAGGLIGSLFSKKARSQATLTGAGGSGIFTRGAGSVSTGQGLVGSVSESLQSIAQTLGGAIANITFGTIGQRGEQFFFDPRTGGGLGQKDFGDPDQFRYASAEEAVRAAIKRALEVGVVEGLGESLKKVIAQSPATQSLESLLADLQFAQSFDEAFGVLDTGLTDFEKNIRDLNASFNDAARQATRLGLAVQRVEDARSIALMNERIDFNKEIQLMLLDITNPLQAELMRLEEEQADRLRNAQAIGGNIAAVEALAALERQQIIEQFAQTGTSVLKDYLRELTATSRSPLAPEIAVQNASREFSSLRNRFLAGDTSLSTQLVDAGRNLLDLRRTLDASSQGFFDTLGFVQDTIEQALGVESAGSDNPQLPILEDIAFANEQAIQQRDEMIELLRNGGNTGTGETTGTGTTPGLGTRTPTTGISGSGTRGGGGGGGSGGIFDFYNRGVLR